MKLEEVINQPVAIFLVGLTGSGKSTFRTKLPPDYVILSTDSYFERLAQERKIPYEQAFKEGNFSQAEATLKNSFEAAIKNNQSIVLDQQNISIKSRAKRLRQIPPHYKKIAIVFNVSDEELKRRLDARGKETGKRPPDSYVTQMKSLYQEPSKAEGFSEIRHINA